MFNIIRKCRNARKEKHKVLKTNNDRCGIDVDGMASRLARFGMLETYGFMDEYGGREDEYMLEIYDMIGDRAGLDAAIAGIEGFLQDTADEGWSESDFASLGMSEYEIRRLLKDLKRHRRCFL